MDEETRLTIKEILRRTTSLQSSVESFQNYLLKLCKISALSPGMQYLVEATSEFLSLMIAGLYVSQFGMDRSRWTNDFTDFLTLREHWRTAYGNFETASSELAAPEMFPD